jgi:hypothetical protein
MQPRSNEKFYLAILLTILFAAGNWYGYKWYAGKMTDLRLNADDLQADQQTAQDALKEIPQWATRQAWIKAKQPPMTSEGDAKANVLDFVEKGATAHKLEIQEQSLNDIQKTAGGVRVNVSIKVKGSMHDLVDWLAPLQQPDNFYAITLFSLKADSDQKSFDCTLQIARFFKGSSSS